MATENTQAQVFPPRDNPPAGAHQADAHRDDKATQRRDAGSKREELDDELEEGLEDTFPASDPVSATRSGDSDHADRAAGRTNQKPPAGGRN